MESYNQKLSCTYKFKEGNYWLLLFRAVLPQTWKTWKTYFIVFHLLYLVYSSYGKVRKFENLKILKSQGKSESFCVTLNDKNVRYVFVVHSSRCWVCCYSLSLYHNYVCILHVLHYITFCSLFLVNSEHFFQERTIVCIYCIFSWIVPVISSFLFYSQNHMYQNNTSVCIH